LEDVADQEAAFGGTLYEDDFYEGFFQTDRQGRPKGVIELDPKKMISTNIYA
jgi:hypothetical protein